MSEGNEDKSLGKSSVTNGNVNIDQPLIHTCQNCSTSYCDFPSLVSHTCRPNRCSKCPATFDMDYQLFLHEKNCHSEIPDQDLEKINGCTSEFAESLDENSQPFSNHESSCDEKRCCDMCEKPLSSRNKSQFCTTCLTIIKKDNRDYNLRFKNVLSNNVSQKDTLNDSVADLENDLTLISGTANITVSSKDTDVETSVAQQVVKQGTSGCTDPDDMNIEERSIDEIEHNINTAETEMKNGTIVHLEDVEQNSENHLAIVSNDVPSTSNCIPIQYIDRKKKFLKKRSKKGTIANMKQRLEFMTRKESILENNDSGFNFPNVSQRRQSKILNPTHELKRSKISHVKKVTTNSSQTHSKCASGKVSLSSLIDLLPDNDCGILLQSQTTNDSNFKCAKCNKVFRSSKLGSVHFSTCKSSRVKKISINLADVRWVCTVCHSHFNIISDLIKHKKICFDFQLRKVSSKRNLIATMNKSMSNYERASVHWCPKCSFSTVSSFSLQNHPCRKRLNYMRSCVVRCHKLPVIDVENGGYLYECEICNRVFVDDYFYSQHMTTHPNHQNVTRNPLIINPIYRPEVVRNIKTESVPDECEKTLKLFSSLLNRKQCKCNTNANNLCDYLLPQNASSATSDSSNPQERVLVNNLNELLRQFQACNQAGMESDDQELGPDGKPKNSSYALYNFLQCHCVRRLLSKNEEDCKPCQFCIPPFCKNKQGNVDGNCACCELDVNNIKMTTSSSEPVLNSSGLNIEASLGFENGSLPLDLIQSLGSTLTPPVSHSGLTPPPTPDNFTTQYSKTQETAIDENMNEATNDPSTSELLPEGTAPSSPTCPVDASSDDEMSDLQIDSEHEQEVDVMSSSEPIPITHIWTDSNFKNSDAWAIISSKDDQTVEKYVCLQCFGSHDQNSLPNHLRVKHGKDISEIIASYMVKLSQDAEDDSMIDFEVNAVP